MTSTKKNKPLLMIPVETKVREFDAKILLAVVALRKGFDVVIGALREMKHLSELLDRGIYLDKSVAKTKKEWFACCRRNGHRIAALDEEGLVYFDAETYRQLRIFHESMQEVELFFAWGEDQAEVMAPAIDGLSERIRLTGNPRFDLLRPELQHVYHEDVAALQRRCGRIILINTSFAFANRDDDSKALLATFSKYPIAERRPGFFEEWNEAQRKVMLSFQEMLPVLHDRFPDHSIVIRPHPSERLEFWQQFASSMPRASAAREGNVVPWILASDVLVHWNCTTAIEAHLLGRPAIAYRKERPDLYEQPLPNACSFHASDPEELIAMVGRAVEGMLVPSAEEAAHRSALLARHVSSLDGKLASERMVDELFLLSQSVRRDRGLPARSAQAAKYLWRSVLDWLDSGRHGRDKYVAVKFPDAELDEVKTCAARVADCLGYKARIVVAEVGRNCFSLSAE